jgi:hypothetical protein
MLRDKSTIDKNGRAICADEGRDEVGAICAVQSARTQEHRAGMIPLSPQRDSSVDELRDGGKAVNDAMNEERFAE